MGEYRKDHLPGCVTGNRRMIKLHIESLKRMGNSKNFKEYAKRRTTKLKGGLTGKEKMEETEELTIG